MWVDIVETKILVVEDDPTLLGTLEHNLLLQYQVLTASDGVTALELAWQERPDLIVLDLVLDGLEVCRILRPEMTVPILMLTARGDEIGKLGVGTRTSLSQAQDVWYNLVALAVTGGSEGANV